MVRSGCYFCEGPRRASESPNRLNTSTQAAGGPKHVGMFADLKTDSAVGAGLHVSVGVKMAPTAKATTSPRD